nr:hypothetical protein [uncultured Rhodopila sp.]
MLDTGLVHPCSGRGSAISSLAQKEENQLHKSILGVNSARLNRRAGWWFDSVDWRMVVSLSRKHLRSGRSFAAPLLGIVFLLTCYLLLAQWDELPSLINAGLAAVHWPA